MEDSGQPHIVTPLHSGHFTPGNKPLISTEQEAGWTLEPTWRFWRRKKSLASARIQTPDHPDCSLVTILTNLTWVQEI